MNERILLDTKVGTQKKSYVIISNIEVGCDKNKWAKFFFVHMVHVCVLINKKKAEGMIPN